MKVNEKSYCVFIGNCFVCQHFLGCAENNNSGPSVSPTSSPEIQPTVPPPSEITITPDSKWSEDGMLKILTIGNSFSIDCMEYVYKIARRAGVNKIVLGNLYIGGCTIDTHVSNAKGDLAAYDYFTNDTGFWSSTPKYKMSDAIKSENWDYISMQQASGSSGIPDTYDKLGELISYVRSMANEDAVLVWNMTWAYQQDSTHGEFYKYNSDQTTMYEMIVKTVQEQVLSKNGIDVIIPAGTAIQNARTSYVGDTLTRDGFHLSTGFGRYVAGLTFVKRLTGLSIDSMEFSPVSQDLRNIAIESANNAVAKPYEVTPSTYTEKTMTIKNYRYTKTTV